MSFRRMLIVLILGLFSIPNAREAESILDDDVRSKMTTGDCYVASGEQAGDTLRYVFWDYILVHSNLNKSRCVVLDNLPFSGYYKVSVIAMYSENLNEDMEEYQFVVDDDTAGVFDADGNYRGVVVPDQNSPDPDVKRTGVEVARKKIIKPKDDYIYVRNDHGYVYFDKDISSLHFLAGAQFVAGGQHDAVGFYAVEVIPPPHVIKEPPFTAGTSNTIEWKPLTDGVVTQEVYKFDNTSLAKSPSRMPLQHTTTTQGSDFTAKFEGLLDKHEYGYFVEALLTNGQTVRSCTTYSTQDASPPSAVKIGSISSFANKDVTIMWNAAVDDGSGVHYYLIVRSEDNGDAKVAVIDTVWVKDRCDAGENFDYCITDEIADVAVPNKVFTYRIDAVDNVGNVSSGIESDIVMQVPPPGLITDPPLVDGQYYKGATITLVADINSLTQPEYHEILFQIARDNQDFFDTETGPDKHFFETTWISISTNDTVVVAEIDLTNGGQNDLNFINGHNYYCRAQLRDLQKNYSAWSTVLRVVPDCFKPSDVSSLTATTVVNEDETDGFIEVKWQGVRDFVSGVDSFYVYRKTSVTDTFTFVDATADSFYHDSFESIGRNGLITYKIGSVDNVGNSRGTRDKKFTESNFQASAFSRTALTCTIIAKDPSVVDGIETTENPDITLRCNFKHFDQQDSIKFVLQLNDVEGGILKLDYGSKDKLSYTLPEPPDSVSLDIFLYKIRVKALFPNKSVSIWSEPAYIQYHFRDGSSQNVLVRDHELMTANYPNPFNPSTSIFYTIEYDSQVAVEIYNVQGQKIKILTNEFKNKGEHSVLWNGDNEAGRAVSSGIYYYKIQFEDANKQSKSIVKRMLLIK